MARNILVFSKLYWPEGGGGELATHLITKEILSKDFDTTIVSGTHNPFLERLPRCRYVSWPVLDERLKPVEWIKILTRTRELGRLIEAADIIYVPSHSILPLVMAAKRINPEARILVHLHGYQPLTYTSILLAGGKPNLANDLTTEFEVHGSLMRTVATGFFHYLNGINQLALLSADKVICASKRQYEILCEHIPSLRAKTSVVYNLLPPVSHNSKNPSERPSIIYAGGGSYIKGYDLFVRATLELIRTRGRREALFYFCGGHDFRRELSPELRASYRQNVVTLEQVSHEEFLRLCSMSWASLIPSLSEEPLPYAVSESMLSGTIPIASRVGGVPEMVNGTLAEKFLFEPTDIETLLDKIETVLSFSKEELIDVGEKLRTETMSKFNHEKTREELLKLFGGLASGN